MTLSQKRIEFSELVTHLGLWLLSEGIRYAHDWSLRDVETQTRLVNSGASRTMKSKHLNGLAMDFVLFDEVGTYIRDGEHIYYKMFGKRAKELGLVWGGDLDMDKRKPGTQGDAGHVEYKEG